MELFDHARPTAPNAPLADRMRPTTLDEMVGHGDVLGGGSFLRIAIAEDAVPSLVLWGGPGTGKTTLGRVIAHATDAVFEPFSAVLGGVKEVRALIAAAKDRLRLGGRRTILFIDEIHRFNKIQQDALLPHVEDGTVTLIGATTENPSFELNSALVSRARVVRLEALEPEDLRVLLERALVDNERGLGRYAVDPEEGVLLALARAADGDARRALTLLEHAVHHASRTQSPLTAKLAQEALSQPSLRHDRAGDDHYDVTSAFIKSLRGSDPDAALYYMARLLEAGDDPLFLTRRMIIFASEDVGNADPRALSVAVEADRAFRVLGMPEGRIVLGQACTYLATAPKSNASYVAIDRALDKVRKTGSLPVPAHIRNAPTALAKEMGHGSGYLYPHDHGGHVAQSYLPAALEGARFYEPTANGYEAHLAARLAQWRGEGQGEDR
jgi:putative ATPase